MYTKKKIIKRIEYEKKHNNKADVIKYFEKMLKEKEEKVRIYQETMSEYQVKKEDIKTVIIEVGCKYIKVITKSNEQKKMSLKLTLKNNIYDATLDDILQSRQCRHMRMLNFYTEKGMFFKHIKMPLNIRMRKSMVNEIFYDGNEIKFVVLTYKELYGDEKDDKCKI